MTLINSRVGCWPKGAHFLGKSEDSFRWLGYAAAQARRLALQRSSRGGELREQCGRSGADLTNALSNLAGQAGALFQAVPRKV